MIDTRIYNQYLNYVSLKELATTVNHRHYTPNMVDDLHQISTLPYINKDNSLIIGGGLGLAPLLLHSNGHTTTIKETEYPFIYALQEMEILPLNLTSALKFEEHVFDSWDKHPFILVEQVYSNSDYFQFLIDVVHFRASPNTVIVTPSNTELFENYRTQFETVYEGKGYTAHKKIRPNPTPFNVRRR